MNIKPQFRYDLKQPGEAMAYFTYAGKEMAFELSNVCNPLGDMLNGLVTLITRPSHLWGEENSCFIEWYGNGDECYTWILTMVDENLLNVKVTRSAGFMDDEITQLLDVSLQFSEFVLAIVSELDTFVKRVGLLNYSQQWQKNEFPITYFLFLKKHLIDAGKWRQSSRQQCDVLSDELLLLLA